jgi:hypothetical protein
MLFSSQSFAGLLFTPSSNNIKIGDEFSVNVAFEHEAGATYLELIGFDLVFEFNDSLAVLDPSNDIDFTADGIQLAEPFNTNGDWALDILGDFAFAANYGFPSIDPFDMSKPVWDILTFDFIAVQEGPFNLNISNMFFLDDTFTAIAANNANIEINIGSVKSVNEPSTILLALLSFIAICLKRKFVASNNIKQK